MRRALVALSFFALTLSAAAQKTDPKTPRVTRFETTLRAAGRFNTFLSLLQQADLKTLGVAVADGQGNPVAAGPGGGPRYQTIFIPNDWAFTRMSPSSLTALRSDPARLRTFLLSHLVEGRVSVEALPIVTDGTSQAGLARGPQAVTKLKTKGGTTLQFTRDARAGGQSPAVNGRAQVTAFQDVTTSDFLIVVHEVDQLLFGDGSV
jgi:uncharacterized surface protein with fasciclin (FAS1) repeats